MMEVNGLPASLPPTPTPCKVSWTVRQRSLPRDFYGTESTYSYTLPTYSGSCLCGKVRISHTSEPQAKILCHCLDCRKISGSAFSVNLIMPTRSLTISGGNPRTFSRRADSGTDVTSYFCADCGVTLFRMLHEVAIVKAGVMDDQDVLERSKPASEVYVKRRADWLPGVAGAEQILGAERTPT